jgi:hypothetical protein
MKTIPAWRWLAAGVLALGLNGWYQTGGAQWAHIAIGQVTHSTETVLDLAKSRAHRFLGGARRLGDLPADLTYLRQPRMAIDRSCKQSSRPQSSPQPSL